MKRTPFAIAATAAFLIIGCSTAYNPASATDQSATDGLLRGSSDDGSKISLGSGSGSNGRNETRIEGRIDAVNVAEGTVIIHGYPGT